ncbi:hypothetical protein KCU61_g94, partial [Aureobasidium melanogenum]
MSASTTRVPFPTFHGIFAPAFFQNADQTFNAAVYSEDVADARVRFESQQASTPNAKNKPLAFEGRLRESAVTLRLDGV